MSLRKIPVINIVSLDFNRIAGMSDGTVWRHLVAVCRLSRKRIIPARVQYHGYRVSRTADRITVHLVRRETEQDSARVSFVPAPAIR
jgi:hypothetical protein